MHPKLNRILSAFPSEGGRSIALHGGIFLLVILPVISVWLWGSYKIVVLLAVAIAILAAFALSWVIGALNLYRQKEEIFLANAGDALVVIDRAWKIQLWNKTAEILTGWSEKEVIGKPFRDIVKFIRERDQSENVSFIEEAMVYGRVGTLEDHTVLIRKDGLQIPVGDSAAPLFDPQGAVMGAIIVFRDNSREHDLEDAREEFMSLAARELHAPLAEAGEATRGLLASLTLSAEDVRTRDHAETIEKANGRALALINTMLNVLSAEQGKLAVAPEPAYVPEVMDSAIFGLESQARAKNISIVREYEDNIQSMSLDKQLMRAVLEILLSNAIKYTPERGTVSARIKVEKGGVVCSVSDTGWGIPEAQHVQVFSKLFCADNIKARGLEGVGLGLYLAKLIVEQSGGKIWFESEENKGTTLYVSYPPTGMKKREGMKGLN